MLEDVGQLCTALTNTSGGILQNQEGNRCGIVRLATGWVLLNISHRLDLVMGLGGPLDVKLSADGPRDDVSS